MSHAWQIEHTTLHDTTDVTIRSVKSQHIPLRLNGSNDENTILIQLLRHAGYGEEAYPYQRHHRNHGWGPKVEGLGIVIAKRYRNGDVPDHAALYELAADTETELLLAARRYAPFAQYFASPMSQPDLSMLEERLATVESIGSDQETAIEQLQGFSQDHAARIENLANRTVTILEEISELRGNVGELMSSRSDVCDEAQTKLTRLWSRSETVYDTLYGTRAPVPHGSGVLARIGSLEASQHDILETLSAYDQRMQRLGDAISRIAYALHDEPTLGRSYLTAIRISGADHEEAAQPQPDAESVAEHAG